LSNRPVRFSRSVPGCTNSCIMNGWSWRFRSTPFRLIARSIRGGDLVAGRPVINPTARLACYRYPVHRIGVHFKPRAADAAHHCYLLYRDDADNVRFIVLNPVTARLLELLREGPVSGREALRRIARELNDESPRAIMDHGQAVMDQLREAGVVLGTEYQPGKVPMRRNPSLRA
jgi:hypothetical protein